MEGQFQQFACFTGENWGHVAKSSAFWPKLRSQQHVYVDIGARQCQNSRFLTPGGPGKGGPHGRPKNGDTTYVRKPAFPGAVPGTDFWALCCRRPQNANMEAFAHAKRRDKVTFGRKSAHDQRSEGPNRGTFGNARVKKRWPFGDPVGELSETRHVQLASRLPEVCKRLPTAHQQLTNACQQPTVYQQPTNSSPTANQRLPTPYQQPTNSLPTLTNSQPHMLNNLPTAS